MSKHVRVEGDEFIVPDEAKPDDIAGVYQERAHARLAGQNKDILARNAKPTTFEQERQSLPRPLAVMRDVTIGGARSLFGDDLSASGILSAPLKMAKTAGKLGLEASGVLSPYAEDSVSRGIIEPMVKQAEKGNYAAAAVPIFGPAAARAGEKIASGREGLAAGDTEAGWQDIAEGGGEGLGAIGQVALMSPKVAGMVGGVMDTGVAPLRSVAKPIMQTAKAVATPAAEATVAFGKHVPIVGPMIRGTQAAGRILGKYKDLPGQVRDIWQGAPIEGEYMPEPTNYPRYAGDMTPEVIRPARALPSGNEPPPMIRNFAPEESAPYSRGPGEVPADEIPANVAAGEENVLAGKQGVLVRPVMRLNRGPSRMSELMDDAGVAQDMQADLENAGRQAGRERMAASTLEATPKWQRVAQAKADAILMDAAAKNSNPLRGLRSPEIARPPEGPPGIVPDANQDLTPLLEESLRRLRAKKPKGQPEE